MDGIKYYHLAKDEELPDEFCAVRDVGGEPSEYTFYVPESEVAKLRELVALWSVVNKHMSLCATIDCEKCPVREECRESVYLDGLLGIDSKELSWRVQERMSELGVKVK